MTAAAASRQTTSSLVRMLKSAEEDFEWYPTTDEIIACVRRDMVLLNAGSDNDDIFKSVLDCGAGDGRVLTRLTQGSKYAIERSMSLLGVLPRDVFVVGTNFHEQTLIDKKVDFVFSNPPYGQYVEWTLKILKEANAPFVYLVIPARWKNNAEIKAAIEARRAEVKVIGEHDFLSADRQARAKVDVLRVGLGSQDKFFRHMSRAEPTVDPFELWFRENFKVDAPGSERTEFDMRRAVAARVKRGVERSTALVDGRGLVNALEQLYRDDLSRLMQNYQSVCELDGELLEEMGVNVRGIHDAIKLKVTSLKDVYWRELFDNLEAVTERLTKSSREKMLDKLLAHTHIDFSTDNAHAVVLWVIKNANRYFDDQLVDLMERMTERANVVLYKSNQRTFGEDAWRYCRRPESLSHYQLDYRVVLEHVGGLSVSEYAFERTKSGLSNGAAAFLDDLLTVAGNIGFDTKETGGAHDHAWTSNAKVLFEYRDIHTGETKPLFEAKAFKNGNLHIKLNPRFICKLNVEFGRLKGWLRSAAQAAEETGVSPEEAEACFASNLQLGSESLQRLLPAA